MKDAGFSIREARVEDLPSVRGIYNHYVANSTATFDERPLPLSELRSKYEFLVELGFPFIVAEGASGEILGYASVYPWRQKAAYRFTVENSIYVDPDSTGKRVGAALMEQLIDRARGAGIREMVAVIADRGSEASIRLHERFGFTESGHLHHVGFKLDRWLGTVLLQKSLQ